MSNKDLVVVDLSHWNPEPNYPELKAGGIVGLILKATEGTTYIDPTFAPRREAAKAAGLIVASYHFLKHGSISQQMAHYVDAVAPVRGERMVIDYEDEACTLSDLRAAVEYLQEAGGLDLQVTIYSGHLIKDQLGDTRDVALVDTSLWIAQYTSAAAPSWPKGTWPTWTLWQYTDKAAVAGISAPVDGNRFNGSADNCALWLAPAYVPMPEPKPVVPAEVLVDLKVNAPSGAVCHLWVNGAAITTFTVP